VRDVLASAGSPCPITIDGFREYYRGLAGVSVAAAIGSENGVRIMAAAIEAPDIVVVMLDTISVVPDLAAEEMLLEKKRTSMDL